MANFFSTRQAAKKLGITAAALSKYISSGKVPAPQILEISGKKVHSWTEGQIEHVRQLLPKIANGRKTWRKKKQLAVSVQRSAKQRKQTQPRATVPHKTKKTKQNKKQIPRAKSKRSE